MTAAPAPEALDLRDADGQDPLKRRLTVSELVATYEQAERDIRAGYELVGTAEARLRDAFEMSGHSVRVQDRYHRINFSNPDDAIEETRRAVWRSLVETLEIRRFASIKAWKELEQQLEHGEVPPLTHETVTQMAEGFRSRIPEMLEQAVQEVFDWLHPRSERYKTNQVFEVGERVILSYVVERAWMGKGFHVDYRYEPELTALENVFRALDGKGAVSKAHYSELSSAIKASSDGRGATELFEFKACKNRNLHVRFLRTDLLARFNAIAGGKRLRGERKRS